MYVFKNTADSTSEQGKEVFMQCRIVLFKALTGRDYGVHAARWLYNVTECNFQ